MTPEDIPACVCTAHPAGDDRRKYMKAVEESASHVVWCCVRCTEITHTAVIQVRTFGPMREMARAVVRKQRAQLPPEVLRLLEARKKPRIKYRREDD
jgi:hypothetical protein